MSFCKAFGGDDELIDELVSFLPHLKPEDARQTQPVCDLAEQPSCSNLFHTLMPLFPRLCSHVFRHRRCRSSSFASRTDQLITVRDCSPVCCFGTKEVLLSC